MCSTCGSTAPGPLRSSAARWLTPKRCCSSITATAREPNSTDSWIRACVPTTIVGLAASPAPPAARRGGRFGRGRGQQRRGRRLRREQRLERAEVLLGERLGRRHQRGLVARPRARAASRTGRPRSSREPTSPISSRCIGSGPARSPSTSSSAARWSPVSSNGSESSQRPTRSPAGPTRVPRPLSARRRRRARQRGLVEQQLLEGEPPARLGRLALVGGEVRRRPARRRPRASRPAPAGRAGSGSSAFGPAARPARPTRAASAAAAARRPEWTGTSPVVWIARRGGAARCVRRATRAGRR